MSTVSLGKKGSAEKTEEKQVNVKVRIHSWKLIVFSNYFARFQFLSKESFIVIILRSPWKIRRQHSERRLP